MAKYEIVLSFTKDGRQIEKFLGLATNKSEARRVLTKFSHAYEVLGHDVIWASDMRIKANRLLGTLYGIKYYETTQIYARRIG